MSLSEFFQNSQKGNSHWSEQAYEQLRNKYGSSQGNGDYSSQFVREPNEKPKRKWLIQCPGCRRHVSEELYEMRDRPDIQVQEVRHVGCDGPPGKFLVVTYEELQNANPIRST